MKYLLMATSVGVVMVGALLPFTPAAPLLSFVALPASFLGLQAAMKVAYLLLVNHQAQDLLLGKRRRPVQAVNEQANACMTPRIVASHLAVRPA